MRNARGSGSDVSRGTPPEGSEGWLVGVDTPSRVGVGTTSPTGPPDRWGSPAPHPSTLEVFPVSPSPVRAFARRLAPPVSAVSIVCLVALSPLPTLHAATVLVGLSVIAVAALHVAERDQEPDGHLRPGYAALYAERHPDGWVNYIGQGDPDARHREHTTSDKAEFVDPAGQTVLGSWSNTGDYPTPLDRMEQRYIRIYSRDRPMLNEHFSGRRERWDWWWAFVILVALPVAYRSHWPDRNPNTRVSRSRIESGRFGDLT